ncbi:MAG TPA: peptidoglycan-binding protein, partial [Flavobacterium sp.]|nr:peptidoglycan-binding protein [Flavobacterium sp.]
MNLQKHIAAVLVAYFIFFQNKEGAWGPAGFGEYKSNTAESHIIDPAQLASFNNEPLTSFYQMNGFRTVWNEAEHRQLAISLLAKADEEGLDSAAYNFRSLQEKEAQMPDLAEKEIVKYDILMTLSVQKYVNDMNKGQLDPEELYEDWDLSKDGLDLNHYLSSAIKGDSLSKFFERARPVHPLYSSLKKALVLISSFPDDTLKPIEISAKLRPNDTCSAVIDLKKRLTYWKDLKSKDTLTKIYDEETMAAVKKFQRRHGLAADGIIGNSTLSALNVSKEKRRKQIIANLERWKWFPKNWADRHLVVNIPEYKLYAVSHKDTLRTHNVVVGTAKRKTPILSSRLSHAVFNPTWTVPPTILKEDVI